MDSPAGAGVCLVEMNSSSSTTTLTVKEDIPLLNKPRETNNVFNRFDNTVSLFVLNNNNVHPTSTHLLIVFNFSYDFLVSFLSLLLLIFTLHSFFRILHVIEFCEFVHRNPFVHNCLRSLFDLGCDLVWIFFLDCKLPIFSCLKS